MTTVLIGAPWAHTDAIQQRFRDVGWEVRLATLGTHTSEDELARLLAGVDGTIARGEPYTRRVLETAARLRVIARSGVGYDRIDLEAATERGVAVCTSVGSNHKTVADFAVMLMLGLCRKVFECHAIVARGEWKVVHGVDFFGKTVGVIGVGRIGKQVVERVRAFECPVLGYDIVQDAEFARATGLSYVPLETLLRESDFVTLHVPLDFKTRHMIGEYELSLMKRSAYLINTARGGVVDPEALYDALRTKRIAGAGLDVFETEPITPALPFRTLDNVILSPHAAGPTHEATARGAAIAAENVYRVLSGQPPLSCVNPEVFEAR